jgi:hypothetical protein
VGIGSDLCHLVFDNELYLVLSIAYMARPVLKAEDAQ